jgi:protein-disulfide isomerase
MRFRRFHIALLVVASLCLAAGCSGPGPTAEGSLLMERITEQVGADSLKEGQRADNPLAISLDERDQVLRPVPVNADDPVWGPADAPVTIVVYSDFECPFCARHADNVRHIKEKYGDLVRVVFKQFPLAFHARAMPAAIASLAALEQGKFWEVHDRFFNREPLSSEDLAIWAEEAGIDWGAILTAVETGDLKVRVERDIAEGESVGVRGTPASFINGVSVSGAVPISDLQKQVDLGLVRAYVLLRKGVAPDAVYGRLTASDAVKEKD